MSTNEKMMSGITVTIDVTPPQWKTGATSAHIAAGIAAAIVAYPVGAITATRERLEMQVRFPEEPVSTSNIQALRRRVIGTIAFAMDEARRVEEAKYPAKA